MTTSKRLRAIKDRRSTWARRHHQLAAAFATDLGSRPVGSRWPQYHGPYAKRCQTGNAARPQCDFPRTSTIGLWWSWNALGLER